MRGASKALKSHLSGVVSLILISVLVVPFLVIARWPAFQDFGEWVYQGYATGWLFSGKPSDSISLVRYPVPYVLAQGVLGLLNIWLNPMVAGVVYTAGYLMAGVVAVDRLVKTYHLRPVVSAVYFTFTIVLSSGFWNGYLGNQLGLVLLAIFLTLPRRRVVSPVGVLISSLIMFSAHGMAYAAWGVVALIFAIDSRRLGSFFVGVLPSVGLAVWYFMASPEPVGTGDLRIGSPMAFVAYKSYTFAKFGGYQNFLVGGAGDADVVPALYWVGVAANSAFLVVLLILAASIVRDRVWLWRERRSEVLIAGVLLVVSMVLPAFMVGIVNPGERVLGGALLFLGVLGLRTGGMLSRWMDSGVLGVLLLGAGIALVSIIAMPLKHGVQTGRPELVRGDDSRTAVLFGHRTDYYAGAAEYAVQAAQEGSGPERPLAWETSLLRTSSTTLGASGN